MTGPIVLLLLVGFALAVFAWTTVGAVWRPAVIPEAGALAVGYELDGEGQAKVAAGIGWNAGPCAAFITPDWNVCAGWSAVYASLSPSLESDYSTVAVQWLGFYVMRGLTP